MNFLFLLSGEGPTDLGKGSYPDGQFIPGPLACLLEQLIRSMAPRFSSLDGKNTEYISETQLVAYGKQNRQRHARMPGLKHKTAGKECRFFYENARVLGAIAFEKFPSQEAIVVLYRDTDGVHSSEKGEFDKKYQSICDGFTDSGYPRWVAMMAKPTSEAWLLCGVQNNHQHCHKLEEMPGNKVSPDSSKQVLKKLLDGKDSAEELNDLVLSQKIDGERIDMPSFNTFKNRLIEVLELITRKDSSHGNH